MNTYLIDSFDAVQPKVVKIMVEVVPKEVEVLKVVEGSAEGGGGCAEGGRGCVERAWRMR